MNEILNETFLDFDRYNTQYKITSIDDLTNKDKLREAKTKAVSKGEFRGESTKLSKSWLAYSDESIKSTELKFPSSLLFSVRDFIGVQGIKFFRDLLVDYGLVDVIIERNKKQHYVKENEGKQVVDFIWSKCHHIIPGWTKEMIEQNWEKIILASIK